MRHEDLFYLLALQKVEGVGDVLAKKLLAHCQTAESVFKTKPSLLKGIDGIGTALIQKLKDKSVFRKAEEEMRFIAAGKIEVTSFLDEGYPERLKHCIDGPLLLFSSGRMRLREKKIISIVGTRQITAYGTDFCRKLIADLSPLDPVIVSGYAYGVDIVAHQAAMDCGLQTIGVLAHGLNQIYPKSHKRHMPAMEANGGFLTEFWSSSNPDKENFVKRNRIVAGISEATIIIESADRGGSLITANMANDYNRDVFAVPGRTTDKYSQGCIKLIKTQKAQLLSEAADLVYMLNWDLDRAGRAVQKQLFVALSEEEQRVYDYLQQRGKEMLDTIALECGFPIYRISSILLDMELKGVVRPLPGKLFEAV